jgi:hypothetical protein
MAALALVSDYISEARVLLEDTVEDYRYSDAELRSALNIGLLEARRLRPDLFLGRFSALPSYSSNSDAVVIDDQYRASLLWYVVGHAQLRDDEGGQDQRAASFIAKFISSLSAVPS